MPAVPTTDQYRLVKNAVQKKTPQAVLQLSGRAGQGTHQAVHLLAVHEDERHGLGDVDVHLEQILADAVARLHRGGQLAQHLDVRLPRVGQRRQRRHAAAHHVEAELVARPDLGEAAAERAVAEARQRLVARVGALELRGRVEHRQAAVQRLQVELGHAEDAQQLLLHAERHVAKRPHVHALLAKAVLERGVQLHALAVRDDEEVVEELCDGRLQLGVGEVALEVAHELAEERGQCVQRDVVASLAVVQLLAVAADGRLVGAVNQPQDGVWKQRSQARGQTELKSNRGQTPVSTGGQTQVKRTPVGHANLEMGPEQILRRSGHVTAVRIRRGDRPQTVSRRTQANLDRLEWQLFVDLFSDGCDVFLWSAAAWRPIPVNKHAISTDKYA